MYVKLKNLVAHLNIINLIVDNVLNLYLKTKHSTIVLFAFVRFSHDLCYIVYHNFI